jgi:hypothetical protein
MNDEILQELWRIKDELAREAQYDVHVLCHKLREQQAALHEQVVDRSVGHETSVTSHHGTEGSA